MTPCCSRSYLRQNRVGTDSLGTPVYPYSLDLGVLNGIVIYLNALPYGFNRSSEELCRSNAIHIVASR